MSIIGIDLGTTNSLVSVYRNGKIEQIPNALGEYLTPSVVSIDGKEILVGSVAKERLVTHPEDTAAAFKRKMGTEQTIALGNQKFSPQELSAFVLKQLKADAESYLGEEVKEAVISVPAYFNDNQRAATREAGLLAGLKVERLINEPSAAALAGRMEEKEEGVYLVFDFGGGTLDVSIVDIFENVIEIVAVSGDNHLGGADFDRKIVEHLCDTHNLNYEELPPGLQATLLRLAEKSKQELTEKEVVMYHCEINGEDKGVFLNNEVLVKCCEDLFSRIGHTIVRALKDSGYHAEDLEDIILVGGSSKMPVVSYFLSSYMGRKPRIVGSPDELVSQGAGIYAGIKERNEDLKELLLTDICPFSLGIGIMDHGGSDRLIFSPIIERNSVLPSANTRLYTNVHDGQRKVELKVYQGEAYYCDENLELGMLELKLKPVSAGEAAIEVTFSYDINGILVVDAKNEKNEGQKIFTSKNNRLSEKEISEKVKELEKYRSRRGKDEHSELILARGRRVFAESIGSTRQKLGELLQAYESALAIRDREAVVQLQKIIQNFIDEVDI
ncbi:MAG: molecular chaperone HscC [Muribaculaceae bacterium]|nr:molecular chaperone HscC [Roseburia sp.]MCM1430020.1 molecular chaperone HscC [Muribaculaceae bacterium]MCM1492953.1 molecular chaperone HscC [Muribaculaceae bacterium]